jgi:hypothetical protein
MLKIVFNAVEGTGKKIYIIIDEYDQFANDLLAVGDGDSYRNSIRARGFVRDFYETLKIGTKNVVDRIFMTGISPILLDDLTSGFNIAKNLTTSPLMNEMLGFTEHEVEGMIQEASKFVQGIKTDQLKVQLKEYYNGYLFNEECSVRMYNPDMILYYFDELLTYHTPPRELIADSIKTDYGRLERLLMYDENKQMLEQIIKDERVVADLVTKFSFDRMYDHNYFVSLLFYMGLLTIDQRVRTKLYLKIPNWVIRTVFWEYFESLLKNKYRLQLPPEDLKNAVERLAYDGEVEPYIEYISHNILQVLANLDLRNFDEKYIKLVLMSYLIPQKIYKVTSEKEVEGGYIDLYLEKDIHLHNVKYEWLWELKYLKVSEKQKLDEVKEKGRAQLHKYAMSNHFHGKDIKMALIIFVGKNEYVVETF